VFVAAGSRKGGARTTAGAAKHDDRRRAGLVCSAGRLSEVMFAELDITAEIDD